VEHQYGHAQPFRSLLAGRSEVQKGRSEHTSALCLAQTESAPRSARSPVLDSCEHYPGVRHPHKRILLAGIGDLMDPELRLPSSRGAGTKVISVNVGVPRSVEYEGRAVTTAIWTDP
jgi:hypothetical protein